jgi:hypothetical protein
MYVFINILFYFFFADINVFFIKKTHLALDYFKICFFRLIDSERLFKQSIQHDFSLQKL